MTDTIILVILVVGMYKIFNQGARKVYEAYKEYREKKMMEEFVSRR